MKSKKVLALLLTVLLLVGLVAVPASAASYTISKTPTTTKYFDGDTLKLTGLQLKDDKNKNINWKSSDKKFSVTPGNGDVLNLPDGYTEYDITVSVTYDNVFVGTFDVTVYKDGFVSTPTKTAYQEGEMFDPSGLSFYNKSGSGANIVFSLISCPADAGDANLTFVPSIDTPLTKETTEITVKYGTRTIGTVPVTVTAAMDSSTVQKVYTDSDMFNPTGLSLKIGSETVVYPTNKEHFSFTVPTDKTLTVDENSATQNVIVYYDGVEKGSFEITVTHNFEAIVQLEGGTMHGQFCKGCGQLGSVDQCANHVTEWIPNGDAGFLKQESETGTCAICGGKVTRNIPKTDEQLENEFNSYFNLAETTNETEPKILHFFFLIIVRLVQTLIPAGGNGHVFGTGIFQ